MRPAPKLFIPISCLAIVLAGCQKADPSASSSSTDTPVNDTQDRTVSSFAISPAGSSVSSDEYSKEEVPVPDSSASADDNLILPDHYAKESVGQSIRLDIPLHMQENSYYCAVACLQMVLDYHGIPSTQDELAVGLKTDPVTGTEYEDLAREASIHIFGKAPASDSDPGYRAVLWKTGEGTPAMREEFESRVKTDLASKDPVFVSINVREAYVNQPDGVHELVLYGADYDENGNAVSYYCMDPSYLSQDEEWGGRKVFSADDLWNAMNHNPEPGYVW